MLATELKFWGKTRAGESLNPLNAWNASTPTNLRGENVYCNGLVMRVKLLKSRCQAHKKEQGWRCGESARLPLMGPGFDSDAICELCLLLVLFLLWGGFFSSVLWFSSFHKKKQHLQIPIRPGYIKEPHLMRCGFLSKCYNLKSCYGHWVFSMNLKIIPFHFGQ